MWPTLFFPALVCVGGFFVVNLFLAVVFEQASTRPLLTPPTYISLGALLMTTPCARCHVSSTSSSSSSGPSRRRRSRASSSGGSWSIACWAGSSSIRRSRRCESAAAHSVGGLLTRARIIHAAPFPPPDAHAICIRACTSPLHCAVCAIRSPSCVVAVVAGRGLSQVERRKLADALEEETCEDGEPVVVEGDRATTMYIIKEGVARVTKRPPQSELDKGHTAELFLANLPAGAFFGESALLGSGCVCRDAQHIRAHGNSRCRCCCCC